MRSHIDALDYYFLLDFKNIMILDSFKYNLIFNKKGLANRNINIKYE